MKPVTKFAAIAGGYVLAFLLAAGALWVRMLLTSGPIAQASSGMYAFGDCLFFLAVFGGCALLPTGAALYFLRPYRRFWIGLAVLSGAVAATGIACAIPGSVAAFIVLRLLLAPVLAMAFLVCALFAPERGPRRALFAACAFEILICLYGAIVFLRPMVFGAD